MRTEPRYLLMQVRMPADPMATHEVRSFAEHLKCETEQIQPWDLLGGCPGRDVLRSCDMVLIGGSGDFSVVKGGDWLESALDAMRLLHEHGKPTFASCWGCQAMARALGGTVVTDPSRAEVGTHQLMLTESGSADPVMGPLGSTFFAQMGHEDLVETLPEGTTLLASSDKVTNQAYLFDGKPIYCTQFHPELSLELLLDRLRTYPQYIKRITGLDYEEFVETMCQDNRETEGILFRFVQLVMGS